MTTIWGLYGRSAMMMGKLGGSAEWGLYMEVVILISTLWGFSTGEWRGVHGKPLVLSFIGVILLLLAISFIEYGTTK